jgi:cytochrome c peroxidase
MGESQLGRTFNEKEVDRLVAFLESLTGEFPSVPYPKLPRTPGSGAPSASGSPASTSGP